MSRVCRVKVGLGFVGFGLGIVGFTGGWVIRVSQVCRVRIGVSRVSQVSRVRVSSVWDSKVCSVDRFSRVRRLRVSDEVTTDRRSK